MTWRWWVPYDDLLLGESLIDKIGALGDGVSRRRILNQWRWDWRLHTMRAKWAKKKQEAHVDHPQYLAFSSYRVNGPR